MTLRCGTEIALEVRPFRHGSCVRDIGHVAARKDDLLEHWIVSVCVEQVLLDRKTASGGTGRRRAAAAGHIGGPHNESRMPAGIRREEYIRANATASWGERLARSMLTQKSWDARRAGSDRKHTVQSQGQMCKTPLHHMKHLVGGSCLLHLPPHAGAQRAGAARRKCTREPRDARGRETADADAACDAADRARRAIRVAAAVFFTRAALVNG